MQLSKKATISRNHYDAIIFDLDGVITQTEHLHRAAWKIVFDRLLATLGAESFSHEDYWRFVDGKARKDGVRSFLAARAIPFSEHLVQRLADDKNRCFLASVHSLGVKVYDDTLEHIQRAQRAGFRLGVISASRNCQTILQAAHLEHFFDTRIDGEISMQRKIAGKPAPNMFLAAALELSSAPERTVVIEDAEAGVNAGRRGGFGLIIGVDRTGGRRKSLLEHGADIVVRTLKELHVAAPKGSQYNA